MDHLSSPLLRSVRTMVYLQNLSKRFGDQLAGDGYVVLDGVTLTATE